MKISAPESLHKARGREMLCKVMICMVALARGLIVCLSFSGGGVLGRLCSQYLWEQVFMERSHGVGAGKMKEEEEQGERKCPG